MTKEKNVNTDKLHKKNTGWVRFFLSVAIIIGLGYVILNYVPFISKYDHYVIVTGSMEPIIMTGDVVIIDSSVQPEDIEIGQIIAFHADINEDGTDEVIVHYLYSLNVIDGETTYKTKPEVSDNVDPWDLKSEDILGIHVLTIPKIGPFLLFAQSTLGKIVLVVDIGIIYLLSELFSSSKKTLTKKTEPSTEDKNTDI